MGFGNPADFLDLQLQIAKLCSGNSSPGPLLDFGVGEQKAGARLSSDFAASLLGNSRARSSEIHFHFGASNRCRTLASLGGLSPKEHSLLQLWLPQAENMLRGSFEMP